MKKYEEKRASENGGSASCCIWTLVNMEAHSINAVVQLCTRVDCATLPPGNTADSWASQNGHDEYYPTEHPPNISTLGSLHCTLNVAMQSWDRPCSWVNLTPIQANPGILQIQHLNPREACSSCWGGRLQPETCKQSTNTLAQHISDGDQAKWWGGTSASTTEILTAGEFNTFLRCLGRRLFQSQRSSLWRGCFNHLALEGNSSTVCISAAIRLHKHLRWRVKSGVVKCVDPINTAYLQI